MCPTARLIANGSTLHAAAYDTAFGTWAAGLEHVRPDSRSGGAGVRCFPGDRDLRLVYGFVVLDVGTRRVTHWNTTEHPTADWTAQQFRMVVAGDEPHRYVLHDRDSITRKAWIARCRRWA